MQVVVMQQGALVLAGFHITEVEYFGNGMDWVLT